MSSLLPIIDAGLPTGLVPSFERRIASEPLAEPMVRRSIRELQVNVGKLCNQTCTHCHVEAGPTKIRENMDEATANRILELALACSSIDTVDLTGGAPEMNPHFRRMVQTLRDAGLQVIDRCNLTILTQPGFEWVADFLADHNVDVVASLPCYLEDNVDGQRGSGVFQRSITALQMLNERGYGTGRSGRRLDLVFNPTSPSLPPDQASLQSDYKREMRSRFAVEFDSLFCITNLPIKRYARYLSKQGKLDQYMQLLSDSFNPSAANAVMCRSLLSISWQGNLFDCDFNQMLEMPVSGGSTTTVFEIDSLDEFANRPIAMADHCYGCTAGAGSSCSGSLA